MPDTTFSLPSDSCLSQRCDSSVGIVTGLWAVELSNGNSIRGRIKRQLSSPNRPDRLCGPLIFIHNENQGSFYRQWSGQGVKRTTRSCNLLHIYTFTTWAVPVIGHAISCHIFVEEAQIQSQACPFGICCGTSGPETGFSPSIPVLPSRHYFTHSKYTFINHQRSIILTTDGVVK